MASLLSNSETAFFTGAYGAHFDTFSYGRTRNIIIHKEPTKTIISSSNPSIMGYGNDASEDNITYTPCSGVFPAVIKYDAEQTTLEFGLIKERTNAGEVRVKLEQNARDFIEDGRKVEKVSFDNKDYNLLSSDGVLSYLGLVYYIYKLQNTN